MYLEFDLYTSLKSEYMYLEVDPYTSLRTEYMYLLQVRL